MRVLGYSGWGEERVSGRANVRRGRELTDDQNKDEEVVRVWVCVSARELGTESGSWDRPQMSWTRVCGCRRRRFGRSTVHFESNPRSTRIHWIGLDPL